MYPPAARAIQAKLPLDISLYTLNSSFAVSYHKSPSSKLLPEGVADC